jgi:hypothetical protein
MRAFEIANLSPNRCPTHDLGLGVDHQDYAAVMENDKEAISNKPMRSEDLEHAPTHGIYLDKDEISHLSEEHRQYLLERHGTLELDPIPTMGTADPYNWPQWKVGHHTCIDSTTANTETRK